MCAYVYMIRVPRVYTSVYDGRYVGVLGSEGRSEVGLWVSVLRGTRGVWNVDRGWTVGLQGIANGCPVGIERLLW